MPNETETHVEFVANPELRKGSYSNFFTAVDGESETILDFYFVDFSGVADDGANRKSGILVSRVILSREKLEDLRNMLDFHIEKAKTEDADDAAN